MRSDPSLMSHLMNGPRQLTSAAPVSSTSLQRVPPALGGSQPSLAKTPATSAGYFSTTESDAAHDDLSVFPSIPRSRSGMAITGSAVGYSTACAPFPIYSRHSLTPPGKHKISDDLANRNSSANLGDLRYVAVAFNNTDHDDSRLSSPEGFNMSFDNKHRPPSMPSLMSVRENDNNPVDFLEANSAYSVVGNRKLNIQPVSSSHGYVTLSNQTRPQMNNVTVPCIDEKQPLTPSPAYISNAPPSPDNNSEPVHPYFAVSTNGKAMSIISNDNLNSLDNRVGDNNNSRSPNGYVTLGERSNVANFPVRNGPGVILDSGSNSSAARSHYVIAAPNRAAFQRPEQLDGAEDVRYVASAPSENLRGRFNPKKDINLSPQMCDRPNTSDGMPNRPKRQSPPSGWAGPSLSKQSSGYVSQEALGAEPLVMSPKRLFSQNKETKVMVSNPHEVSFV